MVKGVRFSDNITQLTRSMTTEGFIIDLLNKLTAMINVRYQLVLPPDGKFGHRNGHRRWDGLIGQLTRQVNNDTLVTRLYVNTYRMRQDITT